MVIEEPLSHAYEQAKRIDVGIFVNEKRTPRKIISKERWENIKTFHLINPPEEQFSIAMNLCVTHYQVPPTSAHQYLEALKNYVTVNKDISTADFYLGGKIYYYITIVNDMYWLPCLGKLYDHFCFDYVG